jgi:hypothetical protein
MSHRLGAALAILICIAWLAAGARADAPQPDVIFSRAKDAWRSRAELAFVTYNLRERYTWRGRSHEDWWQGAYRDRDRNVALHRIIVASDEEQRLKGAPIALNLSLHHGQAHADSLDTNPNADAFPILDPLIEPNASFGLVRRDSKAPLVNAGVTPAAAQPSPTPAPNGPSPAPSPLVERPLRELVHVEAVARDYSIALAGLERVRGIDTYHLTLVPVRQPSLYRLRDLWVATSDYATVQLAVQGLFDGRPYDAARWIVDYVTLGGRAYVQQIHTDDSLRFGMDRIVSGLQYDFVAYDFPASVPEQTFMRLQF